MKLAEALLERAGMQKRLAQLRTRATQNARVQEGDQPDEAPTALLAEFDRVAGELSALILRINRTNLEATLADGRTLTEAIARRDALAARRDTYLAVAQAAAARIDRFTRSEVKFVAALPVRDAQAAADDLARQFRQLDTAIQEANWANELLD